MRPYKNPHNVQKKSYYSDRFWVAPRVPRSGVESDAVFAADLEALSEKQSILEAYIELGQMVIVIRPEQNVAVLGILKNQLGYDILTELSAMDYLEKRNGFEIFYQMLSMEKRKRIRVKCFLPKGHAIESVEKLFRSADWQEREMLDMFGMKVNNHPYPKRLLMPDDWEGHPLLKSYPLIGDEAASWYEIDKIFGKEYRAVVGPENRDPARIDRHDTFNFARVGHEVEFGAPAGKETPVAYQEKNKPLFVERFDPSKTVTLPKRK